MMKRFWSTLVEVTRYSTEYLKQGRGEHIVRVEFACMGKAVCGNFHRILLILSYILLLTV